ncbi:Ribosome-binding ATPase YchF [Planctomycetes bacterium Pan216]|uniref:Ribosome-binding ATPase YchF n=1 Tax=Kolteria novifilia TaxID=2527975 RepID=A0A518B2E3_9BACT|nr:Ribosome-binding ATPase YchF [Planctomycetes bacterium Pan216]
MRVGIVGYSQSGKSTLFQALTGVAPDPAAALKGQIGIAKVGDDRLDFLTGMFKPKKTTPATVEFIDTPGLIPGQKADNPQRIATLRGADGLLAVLNGFSDPKEPAAQLESFRDELLFADLEVVTNRLTKLEAQGKRPKSAADRERDDKEIEELKAVAERLESGQSIAGMEFSEETGKIIRGFQLFSLKPEIVVLNCSEDTIGEPPLDGLKDLCNGPTGVAAKLELDLAELDGEERATFMEELGVTELAKDKLIRAAYDILGLISFFTVGEDECKAWTIDRGTTAVDAAGKIHSDIARGFIRAELCNYADLVECGSMKEVKAKGLQRLEGKEYIVADGDIINFRFNV